jgi:predicted nucleic acid-binding protein
VRDELQVGVDRGKSYLEPVISAIVAGEIQLLTLTEEEQDLTVNLPRKLNTGEREAIVLCQQRGALLLSNDLRAIRYCHTHAIDVVDLPTLLHWFWTRHFVTRTEVAKLINKMEQIKRLALSEEQRAAVFAPRRRRRK